MLLQRNRERARTLPPPRAEDNHDRIPSDTSTFEDLLVKVAHAYPDLILLAMEIKDMNNKVRR